MSGLVHSNHAGTNVLLFNPAGMHHQKDWLSIHIIGGDIFLGNDYMYLKKEEFKFSQIFSGNIPAHPIGVNNESRNFYIYDRNYNTRLDLDIKIQGPSAMFILNEHAFALFSSFRSIQHIRNITPDLGRTQYYGFAYTPQQNQISELKNYNNSSLSWGEIGISYAYQWNRLLYSNWNFGISIKRLYGFAGYYSHTSSAKYNILNDSTIDFLSYESELAFSMPIDYDTDQPTDSYINGTGWAFDIGVEYQRLLDRQSKSFGNQACSQPHFNYKYRIGVSLVDFGKINFNNNAQLHQYTNTSYTWVDIDTTHYNNWNQMVREISNRFYGDPNATYRASSFNMWLPASLNIDFDYNFENQIYLNTSLVYNFPINGNYMQKPSIISIAPRFEAKDLEVNLTASLYQWRYPRVGLSLRLYFLTIGSDYLTSMFGWHDFNGTDFYFSIKFNIGKGSCTKRNKFGPCGEVHRNFPWSD